MVLFLLTFVVLAVGIVTLAAVVVALVAPAASSVADRARRTGAAPWLSPALGVAGLALIVGTVFLPWVETERFGDNIGPASPYPECRTGESCWTSHGVRDSPGSYVVPAVPIVVWGLWFAGVLRRRGLAVVAAGLGTAMLLLFELTMPLVSVSQSDERYYARAGLHLALLGYVLLLASALIDRPSAGGAEDPPLARPEVSSGRDAVR